MKHMSLTSEQEAIINHPFGHHARVMAVAGAGKTSTMVQLVKRYIESGVPGRAIQVLMFNVLARKEFKERFEQLGLPPGMKPEINTFHSFAFQIIRDVERGGFGLREVENWSEDGAERIDYFLRRIITDLERSNVIPPKVIDLEMAKTAIALWKAELVPPDRARAKSTGHPGLVEVYIQFEHQRIQKQAFTFDDLIVRAVQALMNLRMLREKWSNIFRLVVVDEYQDVNYAQQKLLECLVGESTDLVVVGDDDQTIYEWRGARPDFILNQMSGSFNGRNVIDYTLSRSFRFGPELAQAAHNVISLNQTRFVKPLVAFNHAQVSEVHIVREQIASKNSLNDQLFHHLKQVLTITQDASKVIILGRTYNQMMNLEALCLIRKVPYVISGSQPFYKRSELITLINYLRLISMTHQPLNEKAVDIFEKIINRPNRYINVDGFKILLRDAMRRDLTPMSLLEFVTGDANALFNSRQKDSLENMRMALAFAHQQIIEGKLTHEVLSTLVETIKYADHFTNFYGNGEESKSRLDAIDTLIQVAKQQNMTVTEFILYFDQLDCTQGQSEDAHKYILVFTTIFQTKGLEFDYVFVPQVMQGIMPMTAGTDFHVWDAARTDGPSTLTSTIDNERRLFYVAITRAKKAAYFGVNQAENVVSQFIYEMHLDETKEIMRVVREANGELPAHIGDVIRKTGINSALRHQLYEYFPHDAPALDELFADESIQIWPDVVANVPLAATQNTTAKPVAQPKKWWEDD
jgi:DNA helicase-2/ATP-dependent DNA helicase PcrA